VPECRSHPRRPCQQPRSRRAIQGRRRRYRRRRAALHFPNNTITQTRECQLEEPTYCEAVKHTTGAGMTIQEVSANFGSDAGRDYLVE
jgi:hypothetical protein